MPLEANYSRFLFWNKCAIDTWQHPLAFSDSICWHRREVFHGPGWLRLNGSNVPSALTDSLVFPTLAFGAFLWPILLGQFAAKVLDGLVCSLFSAGWMNAQMLLCVVVAETDVAITMITVYNTSQFSRHLKTGRERTP